MKKIILYSLLLILGLIGSQFLAGRGGNWIELGTMFSLAFIMIHVGYEFEIDKTRPKQYAWDYLIAGTTSACPWIFCAAYFVWIFGMDSWTEALLLARFASPTSAGVLFSMLAAAGLSATWMFRKARVLAIFGDIHTILLMIPLKIFMVGMKWQLAVHLLMIFLMLRLTWSYLHRLRIPISYPWVILYAAVLTATCEIIFVTSHLFDDVVPIHLEILLPAFALGAMLKRPSGENPHRDDTREGHQEGPESPIEQRVSMIIAASFMFLIGLSMPVIEPTQLNWKVLIIPVLFITLISNLGKMFPLFFYRKEVSVRERLALSIGMFPRGEVGAGVLVVSMRYHLGGAPLTVAILSLVLNLILTGVFIVWVKKLLSKRSAA